MLTGMRHRPLLAFVTFGMFLALPLGALSVAPEAGLTPIQAPQKRPDAPQLAPYVPTPQEVVDRMLQLAQVSKGDVIYDLGCGDGRIPITAAKRFGARGVGVDIDPQRIAEANANAKKEGVTHLVSFKLQDAMTTDVSDATVVTLYLLSASNLKLRPILTKQLKPSARIVSHAFSMGDWQPDKVDTFVDTSGTTRTLYLWKADGKVRP
jgi:SAM-dependent methyltransferase